MTRPSCQTILGRAEPSWDGVELSPAAAITDMEAFDACAG